MELEKTKIELYQYDWIPGFAAFMDDGRLQKDARAHVVLNLGAFMGALDSGEMKKEDLPYLIAESVMHEVIHVLESWAQKEFNEEKVEELLQKYRDKYNKQ